jgi:predicted transcriptional regulator
MVTAAIATKLGLTDKTVRDYLAKSETSRIEPAIAVAMRARIPRNADPYLGHGWPRPGETTTTT